MPLTSAPQTLTPPRESLRTITGAVLVALLAAAGLWALDRFSQTLSEAPILGPWVERLFATEGASVYLNPLFPLALALILVVERWMPADEHQPIFSAALRQDFLYFLLISVSRFTFLVAYAGLLATFYHRYLDFLTVESATSWPWLARISVGVLLADFVGWLHHWVIHKVPLFWSFHTIHHSQREINLFSDLRYHPLEYLVTETIKFIPLLMFEASVPAMVGYHFAHQWYTKLYHANIRTDFGFLRYILVTPQSHRVHHSSESAHADRNFGVIFSIWDRLFGTHCTGNGTYPRTGIEDCDFPHPESARIGALTATLWAQLLYPFRLISRRRKRHLTPE